MGSSRTRLAYKAQILRGHVDKGEPGHYGTGVRADSVSLKLGVGLSLARKKSVRAGLWALSLQAGNPTSDRFDERKVGKNEHGTIDPQH